MKLLKKFQDTLNVGLSEFGEKEDYVQTGCLCLIYGLEVPSEVVVDVRNLNFKNFKGQNGNFTNFTSVPDALFYKKNILQRIFEAKNLFKNPDEGEFTGNGAISLIQELKNKPDIENIIKYFSKCNPLPIKNRWTLKQLPKKDGTDSAYPLEIINPLGTSVATLHQLDTYLLECYLKSEIKGVTWTNGLCWKIWTKDASENINPDKPNFGIKLDKAQLGYVKNDKDKIEINLDQFVKLLTKLKHLFRTL